MSVETNDRSKEKGWTRERIISVAASLVVILVLAIVSYHIGGLVPVAAATTPEPVNANAPAPAPAPAVTAAPPAPDLPPIGWAPGEVAAPLMQGHEAIPQIFVISRDGRILKRFVGFSPANTSAQLKQALEDALN